MAANHLIHEKSPYLQQHAFNPVDWYPWTPEALAKARNENKPIFLSIGYSTCHWCHVMEHESFEDEATAQVLNANFVPIKVDREERPDLDRIYMSYVQAATGSGGWPMSVWLTPDGKPFVGGTYFPPEDRYGRPGFRTVLERIAVAWREEQDRIVSSSDHVLAELEKAAAVSSSGEEATLAALDQAFALWRRSFDAQLGGFGNAPKFPRPAVFEFLLRYYARTRNPEALEMVATTLRAMGKGGMNDQLGGGFHRYSVDEYWFVPHFEKMLYDQAQIAMSLIEVFQITGDVEFASEARRVLDYVLRDMTSPEGGFYSAEDADSVIDAANPKIKGEGAFYVFRAEEIREAASALFNPNSAHFFPFRFGVQEHGNVENDPHSEFTGRNILYAAHTLEETAHHFDAPLEEVASAIATVSAKLLELRASRVRPHLDDKILTSWNGLMISAFAKAGAVFDEPRYNDAARKAADFLKSRMWNPETRTLLRRYRDGDAAITGFLDDSAFFAQALVDLYEAQLDFRDLAFASELAQRMIELFEDRTNGAFFSTSSNELLLRMKDDYDGAEPSGNSIAAITLIRLERMTGRTHLGEAARRTLRAFAGRITSQAFGVPLMLCALDLASAPPRQVVLAGDPESPDTGQMRRLLYGRFDPGLVFLMAEPHSLEGLAPLNPALAGMASEGGRTAAYVCENFTCALPVTRVEDLAKLLQ